MGRASVLTSQLAQRKLSLSSIPPATTNTGVKMSVQATATQTDAVQSRTSQTARKVILPEYNSVDDDLLNRVVDSSYGSIQERSASLRPPSTPRSSQNSSNSFLSFVSINSPPPEQLQSLNEVDEDLHTTYDEGIGSSYNESQASEYSYDEMPEICCACIRITPKRFRNASKFRKFPRNFGLLFVYMLFFILGIAERGSFLVLFYSLNAYHKLNPPETAAVHMFILAVVHLLYPVMGFVADTFFGRYKVILACLHISWFGSAILAIAFVIIDPLFDARTHTDVDAVWSLNSVIALSVGYVFVAAGLTGIRVNLIPFGVDQIPDASSGELSSYFHWFYWCYSAGNLVGILTLPFIYIHSALSFIFAVVNVSVSILIILLLVFRNNLQILPKTGNPLAHIYKVLRFAAKTPKPRLTSAFQRGQRPPPWIDRAMLHYGGKYTVEEVENVKTFFRILLILSSFFGYYVVYAHVSYFATFKS